MSTSVRQNDDESRFEILVDGSVVGYTEYKVFGDEIVFTHTVIDDDERGSGLGGELVQGALDAVRDYSELRVVAQCPFTASWIADHTEYQELLER
jgi:predicted GNAT family acetyltransferase